MAKRLVPSVTIYTCDRCGREEDKKWTAGDGWWHHNDEHSINPHTISICNLCVPAFKEWVGQL